MSSKAKAPDGAAEWVTWPEAAAIVGCPVPTIDWYTRNGRIATRPHLGARPCVSSASANEFAIWWTQRQIVRQHRRDQREAATKDLAERRAASRARDIGVGLQRRRARPEQRPPVPPEPTGWVTADQAATILDLGQNQTVRLGRDGKYATTFHDARWWISEADVRAFTKQRREWVSHCEAARIAGCSPHTVGKAVRDGRITRREIHRAQPSLSRVSVEAFAREWAAARAATAESRALRAVSAAAVRPPDDGDVWFNTATAALVLGLQPSRIRRLAQADRVPHTTRSGRAWYRRSHIEQLAAARETTRAAASESQALSHVPT